MVGLFAQVCFLLMSFYSKHIVILVADCQLNPHDSAMMLGLNRDKIGVCCYIHNLGFSHMVCTIFLAFSILFSTIPSLWV
jgi:hypothetical protein